MADATPWNSGRAAAALVGLALMSPPDLSGTRNPGDSAPEPARTIVVSLSEHRLWLVEGSDTLFSASVALGRQDVFRYNGRTYRWTTPPGRRQVLQKKTDPIWTPPDWHYFEKAERKGLEPVRMERGERYRLSDGTYLEVRDDQVGRVNRWGNFWPWTPGSEIIFDGMIFIPPFGTAQREVPDALGTRALALGNGYLIHGTWEGNRSSIGSYASHGCIRMYNEDVERLFAMVDVGTDVVIR
jgi:hypothetical protein